MSEHDAASVVGQMAGLDDGSPRPEPVTPEDLIKRFVTDDQVSGRRRERRDDEGRYTLYQGFCGYVGGRGDSMVVGFDDGYSFMGHLNDRGWGILPNKGDWPYVVYLGWRPREGSDRWAIIEYCEADLSLWLFDDRDAANALYRELKDCP